VVLGGGTLDKRLTNSTTGKHLPDLADFLCGELVLKVERTGFTTPAAVDLLKRFLKLSPGDRISIKEALNHGYFHELEHEE
jgi:hypothetical protein